MMPTKSIVALLNYLERDEHRDWEANGQPKGHIYTDVVCVREWLDTQPPAEEVARRPMDEPYPLPKDAPARDGAQGDDLEQQLDEHEAGQSANVTKLPWPRADNCGGPRRSTPGQGQQCFIYVLGRADKHADSVVHSYGKISAGLAAALGEDFAETIWPVVVKVKPHVVEGDLIQHLRDLADVIESHPKPDHVEELRASMRRHWAEGINPPELQKAVRRDCPAATLEDFNAAADDVWAEIRQS